MDTWATVPLGEVAEITNGGAWKQSEYVESGVPIVRVSDITDGTINISNLRYLPKTSVRKYRRHLLHTGDLIVSTVGSHPTQPSSMVGIPAIIPHSMDGSLLNQNAVRIAPKATSLDKGFLGYLGQSSIFRNYIAACARGAASQVRMSIQLFKLMPIPLPPNKTQRKIAAVLSAYDDLIENNTRRIAILEEMAQALYREWFVHFRFPGHEDVEMVEVEGYGLVPEGWEVVDLQSLYLTSSGGTPSRQIPDYFNGDIPWVKTRELHDRYLIDTEECITELGLNKSSAKLFPANTVIMAMYGATIGQLGILAMPAATNQACCAFSGKEEPFDHVYAFSWLKAERDYILSFQMGAAQQNISQKVIKQLSILKPSEESVRRFCMLAGSWIEFVKLLQQKNANLRQTRDLLLPRLISGELDVSRIEVPGTFDPQVPGTSEVPGTYEESDP